MSDVFLPPPNHVGDGRVPERSLELATRHGRMQWIRVADPTRSRRFTYALMTIEVSPQLVGILTVRDPESTDPELRRPHDPEVREVDTIWLHPLARRSGVGTVAHAAAKADDIYEAHSGTRTDAGARLVGRVDDSVPPRTERAETETLEESGRWVYEQVLEAIDGIREFRPAAG